MMQAIVKERLTQNVNTNTRWMVHAIFKEILPIMYKLKHEHPDQLDGACCDSYIASKHHLECSAYMYCPMSNIRCLTYPIHIIVPCTTGNVQTHTTCVVLFNVENTTCRVPSFQAEAKKYTKFHFSTVKAYHIAIVSHLHNLSMYSSLFCNSLT